MRVEQAVYGEVEGRGHGLRGSSTAPSFAANIAPQLDLPDGVPPGVQAWSPFVRGFPYDGYYVLARTFLDSGSSRGGMVLTHALIVDLEDICQVEDLAVLFRHLAASIEAIPSGLSTLEIETSPGTAELPIDLIGAANALADQQGPAIRLGVAGFENLVTALWCNLWSSMRKVFAFRLSFGPQDLEAQPGLAIVCTPEQLQARWAKHRVVNPDDQAAQSPSAAVLCGQQNAKPFLELAGELGLETITIKDLNKLETLHRLVTSVDGFDDLLKAIRLVDGLSNRAEHGTALKGQLIQRIAAQVPTASCKQLMPMRNLALSCFASTKPLWSAIEHRVGKLDFAQAEDVDLAALVEASADGNLARPVWRAAVMGGLSTAGLNKDSGLWGAIWRWAELSHAAFSAIVAVLPSDVGTEQLLVRAAPRKLDAAKVAAVPSLLLKKGWLTAHGATLAAMMSPREAAEQQLKVDRQPNHTAGLRSALRYATPDVLLTVTLSLKDQRLIEMCADLAVTHPKLLSNIRCEDITEQKVWACAIGKSNSLWSAPSNPMEVRDNVLAHLGKGSGAFAGLVETLARTPLADLTGMPDRVRLWSHLPALHRDLYLHATASGWLTAAANSSEVNTPEPELEHAVLASDSLQSVLQESSTPLKMLLTIVRALPSFDEAVFVNFLMHILRHGRSLSTVDATQLGTLMAIRGWASAIRSLCEIAERRYDLVPTLKQCANFLNFYQRWKFGISKLSTEEKWQAFEEVACELYPNGPDHDQLWSRAGGKNSDLPGASQNGAVRWYSAINSLRYGSHPPVRDLLRVMCNDYSRNEKLRLFASDTDIVGRR